MMIFSRISFISRVALLAAALPVAGVSASMQVNITAPGSLSPGGTITNSFSTSVDFLDGDDYSVVGTYYDTHNPAGNPVIRFFPTVTLTGAPGGKAAGTDTISLDFFQNFFDATPGDFNGTYHDHVPLVLTSGVTYTSGDATFDGTQDIGVLGPVAGPISTTVDNSKALVLSAGTLSEDVNFTLTFAQGAPIGSIGASPSPEPSEYTSLCIGLVGLVVIKVRKLRLATGK